MISFKHMLHKLGICDWEGAGSFRRCSICKRLEHFEIYSAFDYGNWVDVTNSPEAMADYNKRKAVL